MINLDNELQELLDDIEAFQNYEDPDGPDGDVNEDHFNKINGEPNPGDHIEIIWQDRDNSDFGYIMQLPNQTGEDFDFTVHVKNPDNSDGIGDAPPEWIHLYELVKNERIKEIKIRD